MDEHRHGLLQEKEGTFRNPVMVMPVLLALMLPAMTPDAEATSKLEEKLLHCEEVVERNDDFNIWRSNFWACASDP